jgi:UDP-N-acetyl-D-mannosaminuronate dehydrogenase
MNDLAVPFHRMGLDSAAVFKAAATMEFYPSSRLVGGHCIPVTLLLTQQSPEIDYHPT